MFSNQGRTILLTAISLVVFFLVTACESHEKKVDDAFDRVKDSKYELKVLVKPTPVAVINTKPALVKTETADEWTLFRLAIENNIAETETQIKQMKMSKRGRESGSKYAKQVIELDKRNNDLRRQINDYNEEVKLKFSKFKVALVHDLDEINIELKDVSN